MLILHLSDIHFRSSEISTAQDPNVHLRNELVRDAASQCKKLGAPDVIIVSGDIAFAGAPDEFSFATKWLSELCSACGAPLESVFVCPGNHDVVRAQADRNLVQLIHNAIKRAENSNAEITKQLLDEDARRLLYEGLDNYNAFALQFFCDLLPPDRTCAKRDLTLNDGSTLRLWGLNTAFVSSGKDCSGDLFVDPASFQITREHGVVNLVVAHHHLTWLRQARELEDHLNDVAPVQMFGHVHTNRIDMNADYLRLTASAANPDRREAGWDPGYNLVQVSVEGEGETRSLKLCTHVRVWQTAPGGFQPKISRQSSEEWNHTLSLEPWFPKQTAEEKPSLVVDGDEYSNRLLESQAEGGCAMSTLRNLALRFYRLSFSKKSAIAGQLELLEDKDMAQPDFERFRRVFARAQEQGRLEELADAIRLAEHS